MWVVVDIRMLDIRMLDWPKISMCETSRGYQQARYAVSLIYIQIFTACLTYWLSHIQISMAYLTYRYPRLVLHVYKYPRFVLHTDIYGLSYTQISTASVTYRYSSQFYIQISTTIHKIHLSTVSLALRILIWTRLCEIGCELQQRPHFELQDNYLYFFWYSTNFLWTNCNSLLRVGLVSIATSLSLLLLYSVFRLGFIPYSNIDFLWYQLNPPTDLVGIFCTLVKKSNKYQMMFNYCIAVIFK